jgi:hypothetical protein
VGRIGVALGEARSAKIDENFYAQMGQYPVPATLSVLLLARATPVTLILRTGLGRSP